MEIGVLAVQGAFIEHKKIIEQLGAGCREIRSKSDLVSIDGLILPGGESTVQGKLLNLLALYDPLKEMISGGMPTLATCAGLILLADKISNDENVYLKTLPVTVKRNAYGRQLSSFNATAPFKGIGDFDMTFIRAPYMEEAADDVDILAKVDGNIVAVKYKNQLGLSFHPELGSDHRIHEMFLRSIRG